MNANNATKRKRNAALLLLLPLAAAAVFMQPQAHAGTITVSGFSPKTAEHVLLKTEAIMFYHRVGTIKATCAGDEMPVSQTLPFYKLNPWLVRACPGTGLSVTFTDTPALAGAAILKHP